MNKQIVLATSNPGKLAEYREILAPGGYTIYSPKDLNIDCDPEENGTNYRENAFIKAKALRKLVPFPVIADDSGLEINALDKYPGLHTARHRAQFSSYPEAWQDLIDKLQGKEDRSAQFVCCICLLEEENGTPRYFEGVCPGRILEKPHGENGFGYDPIFHSDEANIDFGIASPDIKNTFSHRGKAIKKLQLFLLL